jgi:hypothetical protein
MIDMSLLTPSKVPVILSKRCKLAGDEAPDVLEAQFVEIDQELAYERQLDRQ